MPRARLGTWPLQQIYRNGSSLKETAMNITKLHEYTYLPKEPKNIIKIEPCF